MAEKTNWMFYIRVADGKKVVEKHFSSMADLYEAQRKALASNVFLSLGAYLG